MRQVVLQLRRVCGAGLEADTASLRLAAGEIAYDAADFSAAANHGRYREAVDLWVGDFLMGCEDVGAEGFRAWLDVEREHLRRLLDFSYERAVIDLETSGAMDEATTYARVGRSTFRWTSGRTSARSNCSVPRTVSPMHRRHGAPSSGA